MDTITKGGVIWEYLKSELAQGREAVVKQDLVKVGYTVQAIENALTELKKEKVAARAVTTPPPITPSPLQPLPPSVPAMVEADIATALEDAFANESKENSTSAPQTLPSITAKPEPATSFSRGIQPSFTQVNQTPKPAAPIPVLHPEFLNTPTPTSAPAVIPSVPLPVRPVSLPTQAPLASVLAQAPKKHTLLKKLGVGFGFLVLILSIGASASYAMTGSWVPNVADIPVLGTAVQKFSETFLEKYPKDKLFGVMLGNLSKIKTASYATEFTVASADYDGSPRPPKLTALTGTAPSSLGNLDTMNAMGAGYFTSLGDLSVSFTTKGILNSDTVGNKKDTSLQMGVTYAMGDLTMAGDAEVMKLGDVLYFRLNKAPSLGFIGFDKLKKKWIKLDQATLSEFGLDDMMGTDGKAALTKALDKQAEILKALEPLMNGDYAKAIYKKSEKVDDHMSSLYEVTIDRAQFITALKQTIPNIIKVLSTEDADLKSSAQDLSVLDIILDDSELTKTLDYYIGLTKINVWIDEQLALPRKLEITSKYVGDEGSTFMKDRQLNIKATMTLSDINTPIKLEAPQDFISGTEAYTLLTGETMEQYHEVIQEANVSKIFYALADYKQLTGTYPLLLSDMTKTRKEIKAQYPNLKSPIKKSFDYAPWGDDMPILETVPKDAFTKAEYDYKKTATDFTLIYDIKLATTSSNSTSSLYGSYLSNQFVNGKNTMTSKAISVEGAKKGKR